MAVEVFVVDVPSSGIHDVERAAEVPEDQADTVSGIPSLSYLCATAAAFEGSGVSGMSKSSLK